MSTVVVFRFVADIVWLSRILLKLLEIRALLSFNDGLAYVHLTAVRLAFSLFIVSGRGVALKRRTGKATTMG